jgi:hypothetical protein
MATAKTIMQGKAIHFFIAPPSNLQPVLLPIISVNFSPDCASGQYERSFGTSEDKGEIRFRELRMGNYPTIPMSGPHNAVTPHPL